MIRPSPGSKRLCEQAAVALVAKSSQNRLSDVISAHGLPLLASEGEPRKLDEQQSGSRVGIWSQQIENGEKWFVRDPSESPRIWADVERIPPKGPRKRVALVGESVARAYLYDPLFTLAAALRSVLSFAEINDVEIVDLARIGVEFAQLTKVMSESLLLEPDVIVVFAGNNWRANSDSAPGFSTQEIVAILTRGGGPSELQAYGENILRGMAHSFIEKAVRIVAERKIPILFVLPEFNLMDWRNEQPDRTPFLSSDETTLWEGARQAANHAFEDGSLETAEAMAQRMIALDGGVTPAGFEILAKCALRRSRFDDARRWLQHAKDAGLFLPLLRSPRCHTVVQDTMRQAAEQNGIALVDLPNLFAEYLSGELPDRRLFLDYCHLTIDGLRVAAACIAERLLPILGNGTRPWSELAQVELEVPSRVLAAALFQAATHSAHWGQGPEILEFQFREALRLDPEIADTMVRFLDSSLRRAPSLICASSQKIAQDAAYKGEASLHLLNSRPPTPKSLNLALVGVLRSVLEPFHPGPAETLDKLFISEFCVCNAPCNLLERAYSSTSLEDWDWLNRTIFYRARHPQSAFKLVCCSRFPVLLNLTSRCCRLADREHATLKANGIVVQSFLLSSKWESHQIEVPSDVLMKGLNTLSIHWPEQTFSRQDRMRAIGRELELGRVPTVPFIYGELSRLEVSARVGEEDVNGHAPVFWSDVHLSGSEDTRGVGAAELANLSPPR